MKGNTQFETIRSEGGLLPADVLLRIREADKVLGGLRGEDYGLPPNEPLNEAIVRSWNRLVGAWASFREARSRLTDDDPGTTITRERWLLVLLQELGYGRVQTASAVVIDGKSYAVSHAWGNVPIHLVGCRVELGTRSRGVAGAATKPPHGTLQELLNRSDERLWGLVSNGLQLRVLRDNSSLTRQAYVEFDLETMFDGDAYADFAVLWLVCHASRVEGDSPQECWLEKWSQEAVRQGTRALDGLRNGVEEAIAALGSGFLQPGANAPLKEALRSGELSTQDYYRQLLRLVYRLLFLFVAEDRRLLHDPASPDQARERYAQWYSTARLRDLAGKRRGTKHTDLWEALKLVMRGLGADNGCPALGLPPLASFLWAHEAIEHLEDAALANRSLLGAVRALATVRDGNALRTVDYKNLGAEELGSVYESLLELHPQFDVDAGMFALSSVAGNERKSSGSYYTPTSLISCLLDSALDPVLDEAAAIGEQAILDLKVCDPACGSGHFLVAAGHRIAKRLASVRTGDEEPSPEAARQALRDVVSRCLYGVDVNPMAVELCKVSLWMEALDPGRPLSFLDAHIKCGNSLLGTTVELIQNGIPDDAFKPIEGDNKDVARALRNGNRDDRSQIEGQLTLDDWGQAAFEALKREAETLESANDTSLGLLREQERLYSLLLQSEPYERAKLAADAWCAGFVQHKVTGAPRITTGVVKRFTSGDDRHPEVVAEVRRIAQEYAFFHWEIEFPHVFGNGETGFDVVIGNPPWDQLQFDDREFFALLSPEIATAKNMAARKKLIAKLETLDPDLARRYLAARRQMDGLQHFIHCSGRFPLTSFGRLNLAPLFAELARSLLRIDRMGRVGQVLPTGIATDSFNQYFFQAVVDQRNLVSLYSFENEEFLFPAVHHATRFCLLTLSSTVVEESGEYAFFLRQPLELQIESRRFHLDAADFALLNPNSRTCPVLRNRRDVDLLRALYERVPVLMNSARGVDGNPWSYRGLVMFMMNSDSGLFRDEDELSSNGFEYNRGSFRRGDEVFVPLYEGKMVHLFDHRFGTYAGQSNAQANQGKLPEMTDADHADADRTVMPRYWVEESHVAERLHDRKTEGWLLGWRRITGATVERTIIPCALPMVAVGDSMFLMTGGGPLTMLACNLSTFVLDFIARQKLGGTNASFFIIEQLPVLPPSCYGESSPWDSKLFVGDWLKPRLLELMFTATDMAAAAASMGHYGKPFRWDAERRSLLRAEVDAAFFHLYELDEQDVDYVMETFPVVKRRDEDRFGHYRTKALILDVYRKMADAMATGDAYDTLLDPPPADPRVAHPTSPGALHGV